MVKVQVDDRDEGRIRYKGDWTPIGNSTRTLRSVHEWGSTAMFTFNGSYVGVFGSIPLGDGENIRVDFQVDDNPVVSTVRIADADPSDDDVWFGEGPLDNKEHTLVIRYLGNDREFLFDYIEYEDTPITVTSNFSSISSPESSSPPSSSPDASSSSPSSSGSISPGTLAGAVVGAAVATAALLFLVLFIRKRSQRKKRGKAGHVDRGSREAADGVLHIAPFNTGQSMEQSNSAHAHAKSPIVHMGGSNVSSSIHSRQADGSHPVSTSNYESQILHPNRFTLSGVSASATLLPPAYGSESESSPLEQRKH